jgi:GNAT superfamily N-acetyltransferase
MTKIGFCAAPNIVDNEGYTEMNLSIRQAAERDYTGLNALFEEIDEYHRKALPQIFRKPNGPARTRKFIAGVLADQHAVIFIAETRARIIGLVHAYFRVIPDIPIRIPCRAGDVDAIIVMQKYRRHGVGKALMERVNQWAGQMRLDRLELSVWDFNKGARDFYRELDYTPAFARMWKKMAV